MFVGLYLGHVQSRHLKPVETRPSTRDPDKFSNVCYVCSDTATTECLFDMGGVHAVRRYCDKCAPEARL
jgi:hypothetical protein